MKKYIVRSGGKIVATEDILEWGRWFEWSDLVKPYGRAFLEGGRRVAWTELPGCYAVSTVFLGIDHGFSDKGLPVLFETMIRDPDGNWDGQWRYSTYEEALAGHEHAVKVALGEIEE